MGTEPQGPGPPEEGTVGPRKAAAEPEETQWGERKRKQVIREDIPATARVKLPVLTFSHLQGEAAGSDDKRAHSGEGHWDPLFLCNQPRDTKIIRGNWNCQGAGLLQGSAAPTLQQGAVQSRGEPGTPGEEGYGSTWSWAGGLLPALCAPELHLHHECY